MEPSSHGNISNQQSNREPKDKNVDEKKANADMYDFQVEKISPWRFVVFIIYTASFLVVLNLRIGFFRQYSVNISTTQYYLNEIKLGYNFYQNINTSKVAFHDIDSQQELIEYIKATLIYGMYQDEKGNIPEVSLIDISDVIHFQMVTPLRILAKRAPIKQQPGNVHFPTRWDLETSSSDQTPYGGPDMTFFYNQEQGNIFLVICKVLIVIEGFILSIPIPLLSYKEALKQLDDAVDSGYFDSQIKELTIDFGIYNTINKFLIIVKLDMTFSPTGRVESLGEVSSSLVEFYDDVDGKFLLVFQIIFCLLLLFFFIQEMTELYAQISNGFPKYDFDEDMKSKLAQVTAKASHIKKKIVITLKGIFNHIKDPWNFLDTISLGCSLYMILIWISLLKNDTIRGTLDLLLTLPDDKKREVLFEFTYQIEQTLASTNLLQRLAGVNILILIFKLLKYVSSFNGKILDQIRVIVNISKRVLPYVAFISTILLAYTFLAHLLYGHSIEEFSTYFTSIRYLFTNIHSSYDQLDSIIDQNQTLALVFHILVICVISFVIVNMFLIYVIHAFADYIQHKKASKKIKTKKSNSEKALPHPLWFVKKFWNFCAEVFFQRIFYKHAFFERKAIRQKNYEKELTGLSLFSKFNIDMSIEEEIKKKELASLNPIFQTENFIRRTVKKNKFKTVKSIWSVLSILLAFIFLTIISMEHHKVSEAQYFGQSMIDILEQNSVKILFPNNTIISYSSETDLLRLQEVQDIGVWIIDLFTSFPYPDNITLKDSGTFQGAFLASQHFMLTDTFRLSIRIRSVISIGEEDYQGAGNLTLTPLFEPDALNIDDEYKLPIIGKSGRVYSYTEGKGYRNAGGYILESSVNDFEAMVKDIYNDGILNPRVNSVVLDFPIYLIKAKNAFRVSLIFQTNAGSFIDTEINMNFLNVNNYKNAGQYIIGLLEVITVIWTCVLARNVLSGRRRRNYHYNYWYSLHIQHVPEIIREKREKKCPEFLRKMSYLFNFECKLNIGIILLIIISAAMWIYYVIETQTMNEHMINFIKKTPTTTNGELLADMDFKFRILFVLKITEGLLLFLMSIKLVYYYSFFDKFYFLIETMRKSLKWIPHMFIILVFILMAFGFFLQLLRGTKDAGYTSIANIVAQQLQFLNLFETQDRTIFDKPTGIFVSLVFYIPWVFFVVSIVGNIFLGVVLHSYQSVKERYDKGEHDIKVKEFFKITKEIITSRSQEYDQQGKAHFDATIQESKNSFKYHQFYEELYELVILAKNYCNDMDLWVTACSKQIIDENTIRKSMRKIFQDIRTVSVVDFNFEKHEHMKVLTDQDKFSQFSLRLKYWNYFNFGRKKLMQLLQLFDRSSGRANNQPFNVGNDRKKKLQAKADLTIKKYIMKLENRISGNIQDLLAMKKKIYEYEQEMPLKFKERSSIIY